MNDDPKLVFLSSLERVHVADILSRRANEIASYTDAHKDLPPPVYHACEREMARLRLFAEKLVTPVAGFPESLQ